MQRQRDGLLPTFPIWDDVRTFDGRPWRGLVHVLTGGFPCQDISAAGQGKGLAGTRSSLWFEMLRIIEEVRPNYVFAENSPNLRTRGLGTVVEGLTGLGYDVRWCVLGAWHAGAPHKRNRMWILARHSDCQSKPDVAVDVQMAKLPCVASDADSGTIWNKHSDWRTPPTIVGVNGKAPDVAYADCAGRKEQRRTVADEAQHEAFERTSWWETEPDVGRVVDELAVTLDRTKRLRAIGNGQVPAVAALAWQIMHGTF